MGWILQRSTRTRDVWLPLFCRRRFGRAHVRNRSGHSLTSTTPWVLLGSGFLSARTIFQPCLASGKHGASLSLQTRWPARGGLCLRGLPRSSLHSGDGDSALRLPSQGTLTDRATQQGSGLSSWLACSPCRSQRYLLWMGFGAFSTFPFNSNPSANKTLQQFRCLLVSQSHTFHNQRTTPAVRNPVRNERLGSTQRWGFLLLISEIRKNTLEITSSS